MLQFIYVYFITIVMVIFALFYFSIGTLSGEGPAGHWKEGFFPLAPKVELS
jgi:hypothetical protein